MQRARSTSVKQGKYCDPVTIRKECVVYHIIVPVISRNNKQALQLHTSPNDVRIRFERFIVTRHEVPSCLGLGALGDTSKKLRYAVKYKERAQVVPGLYLPLQSMRALTSYEVPNSYKVHVGLIINMMLLDLTKVALANLQATTQKTIGNRTNRTLYSVMTLMIYLPRLLNTDNMHTALRVVIAKCVQLVELILADPNDDERAERYLKGFYALLKDRKDQMLPSSCHEECRSYGTGVFWSLNSLSTIAKYTDGVPTYNLGTETCTYDVLPHLNGMGATPSTPMRYSLLDMDKTSIYAQLPNAETSAGRRSMGQQITLDNVQQHLRVGCVHKDGKITTSALDALYSVDADVFKPIASGAINRYTGQCTMGYLCGDGDNTIDAIHTTRPKGAGESGRNQSTYPIDNSTPLNIDERWQKHALLDRVLEKIQEAQETPRANNTEALHGQDDQSDTGDRTAAFVQNALNEADQKLLKETGLEHVVTNPARAMNLADRGEVQKLAATYRELKVLVSGLLWHNTVSFKDNINVADLDKRLREYAQMLYRVLKPLNMQLVEQSTESTGAYYSAFTIKKTGGLKQPIESVRRARAYLMACLIGRDYSVDDEPISYNGEKQHTTGAVRVAMSVTPPAYYTVIVGEGM